MDGKIALEEHVTTPRNNELWDAAGEAARNGKDYMADVERRLLEVDERVKEMDRYGIEATILSLTSPGAQSITDAATATAFARETNDTIKDTLLDRHPGRLFGFAAVALQDPASAADELDRAVTQLGYKGALINGYTNLTGPDDARYLDEPDNHVFWDRVAALNVPVYLHPREPLPSQTRIYQGYASLVGSAWAFAHETATHAVRLMLSGLFDRHPGLTIILGHLGEGLPFLLPRLEHRLHLQRHGTGLGRAQRPVSAYLSENFYLTTSGHFHTKALHDTIAEMSVDAEAPQRLLGNA
ncbi:amidohydrolase [Nonomuraea sp. MG754425]|uniref:amidohydrolase family protein n=1 Tax=Nonomuraea sp. MG754425 TaxID=2570319 RepID=UPI001F38DC78|nr:amidohydrolase [Nonomuraea sp. MG754425]